jgi:long-chain acyl-CoA synthetase
VSDPFAVYPLAIAAGGGQIDGHDATRLAMAGFALLRASAPLARALVGRRAAILLPTSSQFVTALAASDGRGAVLINPLASPREVAFQIAEANVGALFTIGALARRVPLGIAHVLLDDAPDRAIVHVGGVANDVTLTSHDALRLDGNPAAPGHDDECAVVYTSAMRGTPLGAISTHRNLLSNARATQAAMGLMREDHVLAVLPYSHLFGLTVTGAAPLMTGARVTTMARFNPLKAAEWLATGGVTVFVGVPGVFAAVLTAIERRGGTLRGTGVRLCICGGAVLDPALQDRWAEATGVELRQGYGLTEAGPVSLFNRVDLPNRRGTLGVPFPGVDISLRVPLSDRDDPADAPADATPTVADGSAGEICVKGENVGPGYVANGRAGLVQRDGWLYSGDRGQRNADGTVSFLGLYKPMFTRNGFNIYPREIERVVGELPGVRSARVRAIPEPARENDIGLDVTGPVSEADVKAWCEARLSAYKQPSMVTVSSG